MRRTILAVAWLMAIPFHALPAAAAPPLAAPPMQRSPLRPLPWLGLELVRDELGARVASVVRGSPAALAGVATGEIVVAVDGLGVAAPEDVVARVRTHAVGDVAVLSVRQGAGVRIVRVELAALPSADERARMQLVGAFAPELGSVALVRGDATRLASLRGRVVVLEFWATWCGPCQLAMPSLEALHKRYGAQGLTVLAVANDAPDRAALAAVQRSLSYAIVADESGGSLATYGVRSLPTTVLIDRRGVVRDVLLGFDPGRDVIVERRVAALLAEPASATPSDAGAR